MNAGTTNAGTTRPGPVDRVLRTVENAAAAVGLTGVVVTVALIVIDVALRYLVGAPLSWSVGFVGDYALVGLFFLGLSYTVREGAHVRIDLVHKRLGPAGRRMLAVTGSALTAVFLALVGYGGLLLTAGALRHGDVPLAGASELSWPVWTSAVLVPIGAGLAGLRSLHTLVHDLRGPEPAAPATPLTSAAEEIA
ncbi:TRAP transporter small permease [Pseudonocardia alni]|uniref:TRAP-type C4-dicarboxylate transport system permease small subunit n=1 Tax=Pseudonocardia alni TaxID=33907 RepID=A0AA44UMU0_PSEA5|nr:TRAP transporter small permease [Pseudonocardia alni]PKB30056.1 TRAP-type C4-dicarboxylate transport system permease small subunit [Pseudonocardia alni]